MILFSILSAVITALANRWRGGARPFLPGESKVPDHKRTQVRRVFFALCVGLLAWSPMLGLIVFISCLTGWGFPVSAATGKRSKTSWEPEFGLFDELALRLIGNSYTSKVYGVIWLTLHGLFFGSILVLITDSWWYLAWAGMGLSYLVAHDWERGELIDGALKGITIGLATKGFGIWMS